MRDRNPEQISTINRWLLSGMCVSLVFTMALAATCWHLLRTSNTQEADILAKSDRLAALVEDERQKSLTSQQRYPNDSFLQDAFKQIDAMQKEMDRLWGSSATSFPSVLFQNQLGGPGEILDVFQLKDFHLQDFQLQDTGSGYELVIPLRPDAELELQTEIKDDVLSISGRIVESGEYTSDSGTTWSSSHTSSRQFSRSIPLPDDVDETGLATRRLQDQIVISVPKLAS